MFLRIVVDSAIDFQMNTMCTLKDDGGGETMMMNEDASVLERVLERQNPNYLFERVLVGMEKKERGEVEYIGRLFEF